MDGFDFGHFVFVAFVFKLFPTLDIFEINGKVTELPVSVYANFSETDVWTFTLNAAPGFAAVKPLIALVVALFLLA